MIVEEMIKCIMVAIKASFAYILIFISG